MLGQWANHLDSRAMMDEGKILLLDLGRSDGETNRLIMRRRGHRAIGEPGR